MTLKCQNQIALFCLNWVQHWVAWFGQWEREQGWRSSESTRLPPRWLGIDSWTWCKKWVEFVVSSLLCSERFFSGYEWPRCGSATANSHYYYYYKLLLSVSFSFDLESECLVSFWRNSLNIWFYGNCLCWLQCMDLKGCIVMVRMSRNTC